MATSYVGLLRDTFLPNLAFHSAIALPGYAVSRATNTVGGKDYLWASAQVANVWYTAIGRRLLFGVPLATALRSVTRPGWLLISGVTLWGTRLTYRVVSRNVRSGADDPRYDAVKSEEGGWTKALWSMFLPEAVIQSLITLPFTAPFRTTYPVLDCPAEWRGTVEALAIGLFGAGFALEVLADWQLEKYKQASGKEVCKEGVWSLVRHPNYLGDILTHFSFPLILYPYSLFNPLLLIGPVANLFFLRHIGGDKENEESQARRYADTDPAKLVEFNIYREEKNAVWPAVRELGNKWTWIVAATGGALVIAERIVRNVAF